MSVTLFFYLLLQTSEPVKIPTDWVDFVLTQIPLVVGLLVLLWFVVKYFKGVVKKLEVIIISKDEVIGGLNDDRLAEAKEMVELVTKVQGQLRLAKEGGNEVRDKILESMQTQTEVIKLHLDSKILEVLKSCKQSNDSSG